ncbi:Gfo/Idh/MocA family oxidoreductase [Polynucleobacter sp. AP-Sanab-80-C2]|uniref:Gfo/Idh/MocA family protein n=1 Tax=Polynucleobacter sp. AP-Sanab-80-C2 TaxID=3108274 RepID=UPI002B2381F1|nr:Gfo/Idh/MocA family oxidoreductase [Polynucleobacter sp. AP-Sanab-80-C2]MEA9598566.1 Gfo/Idh/MocA family oxidoreductase [Polynucleobacter sp. AP-Sanab-80-C2]
MLNVMLIGLGKIGMLNDYDHSNSAPIETLANAFSQCPSCNLVSAVDPDQEKRGLFQEKYNTKSFSTISEAANFKNPDIAIIATPTNSHAELFESLLENCKPQLVLCEKPLSFTRKDGLKIKQLSQKLNVPVVVNYMRRTDSSILKVKNLIESGEIRGSFKGVGWYSKGIFNNGSHLIDIFQFIFGEIKECKAISKPMLMRDNGDLDIDIFIRFNDAEFYLLATNEVYFSNFSFTIHCNNGTLSYNNKTISWSNRSSLTPIESNILDSFIFNTDSPILYLNVANDVCNFVNKKEFSLTSLNSAYQIVDLLEGLKESIYAN